MENLPKRNKIQLIIMKALRAKVARQEYAVRQVEKMCITIKINTKICIHAIIMFVCLFVCLFVFFLKKERHCCQRNCRATFSFKKKENCFVLFFCVVFKNNHFSCLFVLVSAMFYRFHSLDEYEK